MSVVLLLLACNRDLLITGNPDPEAPVEAQEEDDTDGGVVPVELPELEEGPSGVAADGGPEEEWFEFGDELQWPESFAWDPVTAAFYVGSLWYGHVRKLPASGEESVFYEDPLSVAEPWPWQTWGVEADPDRRRLFVCASWIAAGPVTWFVWVLDLDTGERLAQIDMSTSREGAQCRDFVVGADGRAFVTDRDNPLLHVVDPVAGTAEVLLDSPLLRANWGPDGIAMTPEGTGLVVNLARSPGFVYVPILNPEAARAVEISGDAYQMGGGQGIDGMVFYDGALYVAAVNRLLRVRPTDATWTTADMRSYEAPIYGMSSVTLAGDRLFALNGDPNAWTLEIRPDLPFEIYRVDATAFP
jgi:sugar lactone lactonase YvrE